MCKGGCYLHTSMAHRTRVRVRQPLVTWGGTRAGFMQMISLISCWTFTSDSLPEHLTSRPNIKILNYTHGSLLLSLKVTKNKYDMLLSCHVQVAQPLVQTVPVPPHEVAGAIFRLGYCHLPHYSRARARVI